MAFVARKHASAMRAIDLDEMLRAAKALGVAEDRRDRLLEEVKRDKNAVAHNREKLKKLNRLGKKPEGRIDESLKVERLMTLEALAQYQLQQTLTERDLRVSLPRVSRNKARLSKALERLASREAARP